MAAEYPTVDVHAVCGDFDHHLGTIPGGGRRLVAFLGGTIGNLDPKQRAEFLAALSANLAPGDGLLLGTDLVKDPARLVAAYDDAAGVTAAFNRNVLAVVNRELDADFDVDRFAHVARWDAEAGMDRDAAAVRPSPSTSPSPSSASSSTSRRARRCAPRSAPSSAGTASTPSWPPPGWTSPGGGPTPPATSGSPCRSGSEAGFSGVAPPRVSPAAGTGLTSDCAVRRLRRAVVLEGVQGVGDGRVEGAVTVTPATERRADADRAVLGRPGVGRATAGQRRAAAPL